jgi:hypothetical protein
MRALQERNIREEYGNAGGLKSKRGDARCRFVTGCRLVGLITKKIYQVDPGIREMEELSSEECTIHSQGHAAFVL